MDPVIKFTYRTVLAVGLVLSASASASASIGFNLPAAESHSYQNLSGSTVVAEDEPPPRGGPKDTGDGGSRYMETRTNQ
ncbi:hypothetical protein [Microcoleus sp. FACHB-672]|uniref:hypothetical protein n=1 Tax=Microcoleus sp. FACHB-672 TaxID=2692825 RepID=UPI001689776E|nr:hypothetical protein [Microcoleus sp. FACHB-672]MBD2041820.1 hypothetical protein [Microcoleus sp. FACHB-672]